MRTELKYYDIMKQYEGTEDFLEFYLGDTDSSLIGRVLKVYEDNEESLTETNYEEEDGEWYYTPSSVIISIINTAGEDDGLGWFALDDLVRVDVGTRYLEARKQGFPEKDTKPIDFPEEQGLEALLELSRREQGVISFESCDDSDFFSYGIVEEYSVDVIKLHSFTTWGEDDGTSYIDRSQIQFCAYKGQQERAVAELIAWRNK